MNQNKFMLGSPVLMGDKTIPGVPMPDELKRLLPEIFRKVSEFGCDFPPTVVEMLTYDEISEIAAYGGFPVRYPHWKWGMEYEELQRGYMHGMHRIYEMVVNCCGLKTRVLTDRGTIFAEDVREGDFVYGRKGPRKVALVNRQKQSPTLKIRLKDQFREVTCTHNHKWLVVCDEGYIWREAKDLSKGDFIVGFDGKSCPAKKPCELNFNDKKCIKDTRPNIRARVKNIKTPSHMTEELAELIGILIGDGCITAKGSSRNAITVCVGLERESYAKYVARLFFKCFGKRAVVYKKPSCFLVTLCSKMAMYFFDHIGLKKGSCFLDKRIPSAIWSSSSEFRRACLKGLFDTDGHISTCIQYSSKSKGLIEDMQLMLAELGVYSRAKHISNGHNNIFVLNVSGRASIKKFAKIIVPKQKYKNEALKKIANTAYCSSNGQALPYFRQRIIDSLPEVRSVDNLNMYYACKRIKKGKFESNALYSFCERAEEFNVKTCEDIKSELETPFYEVEEVLDDVSQETIDIALFHDDHDFVAEGLMSHNTNPCYLYCLDSNTLLDNVTVVAHALGHADFFKNNIYFAQTSQNMMNELANHGTRIRRYMSRWGKERVTEFIDHVLRIETLIDPAKAWEPKRYKNNIPRDDRKYRHPNRLKVEEGHDYMDGYLNTEEWIREQRKKIEKMEAAEYLDLFVGSTKDIMGFIRDNAPLKTWESDIVSMLYEESMYFAPQRMTKAINEGWASFTDYQIIARQGLAGLGQESDSAGIIEYAKHKMGVLGGKYSMNPYKLGFSLFCDIEERWNKGQFGSEWEECTDIREKENWDRKVGLGKEKVFEVRKLYNDITFIMEFFTPDFCEKYEFFEWKKYPNGEYKIESKDPHRIKAKLVSRYMNGGLPEIRLVDPNHRGKGIMFLQHNWHGRPLHEAYVGPVLESLRRLWRNDVCLATKNKEGRELIYRCKTDECIVDMVPREDYES
jgi:stage V sporulation protein R